MAETKTHIERDEMDGVTLCGKGIRGKLKWVGMGHVERVPKCEICRATLCKRCGAAYNKLQGRRLI